MPDLAKTGTLFFPMRQQAGNRLWRSVATRSPAERFLSVSRSGNLLF